MLALSPQRTDWSMQQFATTVMEMKHSRNASQLRFGLDMLIFLSCTITRCRVTERKEIPEEFRVQLWDELRLGYMISVYELYDA